jgi:hypothetical protein
LSRTGPVRHGGAEVIEFGAQIYSWPNAEISLGEGGKRREE